MINNISLLKPEECCGCRACGDICPRTCISFVTDKEGFYYPSIDDSACIGCGLCRKICPSMHPHLSSNAPSATYVAYTLDREMHRAGSSGGLFGIISTWVIEHGGRVWGAAFDSNLKLHHCSATNRQELASLMKSKYIQSDTAGIYKTIKHDLQCGVTTLFAGTPCQSNGLRNYLGDKYENLIIIDLLCHGVPSQDLFDKSIRWFEHKKNCTVTGFQFRYKERHNRSSHMYKIDYIARGGGEEKSATGFYYDFPAFLYFCKYISLRPSCYECKWSNPHRCGDITIGDFWGIEKIKPYLDAKNGISMLLANTDAGNSVIEKIKDKLYVESVPFEFACKNNGCLLSPAALTASRSRLYNDMYVLSFDDLVKKWLSPKKKLLLDTYYNMPSAVKRIIKAMAGNRLKI